MAEVLKAIPQSNHPNLLVGFNKADDAGIYKINEEQALVQTVDFFPPIVDDPFWFGQIAAANALSDVFAMGGQPITALNIVGFPSDSMPSTILSEILKGGARKVEEAGAVIVGGHSIKDKELKYGLSVTGLVNPGSIRSNAGAKKGDKLFLTKPLGTGIIATGIKRNLVSDNLIEFVTKQMAQLNKKAADLMLKFSTSAVTDITGFGLVGHALEMAEASGCSIRFFTSEIPIIPDAFKLAEAGAIPGGTKANQSHAEGHINFTDTIGTTMINILFDPQTSGGLLIAIDNDEAADFQAELTNSGLSNSIIGEVIESQKQTLFFV